RARAVRPSCWIGSPAFGSPEVPQRSRRWSSRSPSTSSGISVKRWSKNRVTRSTYSFGYSLYDCVCMPHRPCETRRGWSAEGVGVIHTSAIHARSALRACHAVERCPVTFEGTDDPQRYDDLILCGTFAVEPGPPNGVQPSPSVRCGNGPVGPCVSKLLPITQVGEWNCQSRTDTSLPTMYPATHVSASAAATWRACLPITTHSSPSKSSFVLTRGRWMGAPVRITHDDTLAKMIGRSG